MHGRLDRNAMRLMPGEVGLRGNRATFHLGRGLEKSGQPVPVGEDGRPTGAVYYNLQLPVTKPITPIGKKSGKAQESLVERKHVVQMLPAIPASTEPAIGPVTGLPVADNEHLFVFRMGKRYNESDDKARLQIEMRMPKKRDPVFVDAATQFLESDITPPAPVVEPKAKKGKKKGGSKKSGSKKSSSKKVKK